MNMKRMRGRNHRPGGGGGGGSPIRHNTGQIPLNRNHVFDSSGPDLRIRGTAQQLFEKYLQLGRDATSSGDRVMAEGYFQHAEHYFRIVTAIAQATQQSQAAQQAPQNQRSRHPQDGEPGDRSHGDESNGTSEQDENDGGNGSHGRDHGQNSGGQSSAQPEFSSVES